MAARAPKLGWPRLGDVSPVDDAAKPQVKPKVEQVYRREVFVGSGSVVDVMG